jgi:hypothetical protein
MRPTSWTAPKRKPPPPLPIELLAPGEPPGQPAVDPALRGTIRLFARVQPIRVPDEPTMMTLDAPPRHFATIVVRDGCLRLNWGNSPHAVFAPGARLVRGKDARLAIVSGDGSVAQVGERVWWEGGIGGVGSGEPLARLRTQCGAGDLVYLGLAQDVATSQKRADEQAAGNFAEMYGVPAKQALKRMQACRAAIDLGPGGDPSRMIENPCGTVPPPPVEDAASCPAGTSHSGGLCRTPEGHVRPIPPGPAGRSETDK